MTVHTKGAKVVTKDDFEQQMGNQSPEILNSFFSSLDNERIQGNDNNTKSALTICQALHYLIYSSQ